MPVKALLLYGQHSVSCLGFQGMRHIITETESKWRVAPAVLLLRDKTERESTGGIRAALPMTTTFDEMLSFHILETLPQKHEGN